MALDLLSLFTRRGTLPDLSAPAQQLITGVRLTVVARRRQVDALAVLAERLGDTAAARHALHITCLTGDLWPERFTLSPPCCRSLTHDEALLAALVDCAGREDRPAFDRESAELLSEDARDQLWRELIRWPD